MARELLQVVDPSVAAQKERDAMRDRPVDRE
jgi:hypothetical protein